MSEVIVRKQIVLEAVDRVTRPLSEMNERISQLEQKMSSLGMKFSTGASEQGQFRSALSNTKATAGQTAESLQKLNSDIDKLKAANPDIKVRVNDSQANDELNKLKNNIHQTESLAERLGNSNFMQKLSSGLGNVRSATEHTKESFSSLKTTIAGTAIGQTIATGVSSAWQGVTTAIGESVKAGISYNLQMQTMNATWTTLTGSTSKAKTMTDSIVSLSNALGQDVSVTDELSQQFYHVLDNQPKTEKLTKSFLTMGDAIGLSGDRLEQVGMDFTHMMSNGKIQLGELNQITDAFPMFGEALLKYERKVKNNANLTMSQLRDDISAGKISSQDAINTFNQLGDKYKKASDNLMGTLPGMARQIKARWSQLMGDAMAPTTNAVNPIVKQISEWIKDKQTTQEFEDLGKAVNNGVGSIMQSLANTFGNGSVSRMLDNAVNGLTKMTKAVSGWTARNAASIISMLSSLGRIAGGIGKGAFDAIAGMLGSITHTKGDGVSTAADALQKIADHQKALEMVGKTLAMYFVATKLAKAASALNLIYRSLLMISTIGMRKSATGTLIGDLINFGTEGKTATELTGFGKLISSLAEKFGKGGKNSGDAFVKGTNEAFNKSKISLGGLSTSAESQMSVAGEAAGGSFIKRFGARAVSGFSTVGRTIGGRLVTGITVALGAVDILRGLTGTHIHDRARMIGGGVGTLIGGGIGAALGGPVGLTIGSMLGNVLGKGVGDFLKKFKHMDWSWDGLKSSFAKAWDGVVSGAKKTWSAFKKWWNNDGSDGSKASSSKSSSADNKTPSQNEIKSLGGNHYSKTDITNVKSMNAAIKDYIGSLKDLKKAIKTNDPTKELNSMNNDLKKAASYWEKIAKPLKTSANSFKTLGSSMKSVKDSISQLTGKNGLETFDKDLKSLSSDVKNSKIADNFKSMADQIKKSDLIKQFTKLTTTLKNSLRYWKDTSKNIKEAAGSFKTLRTSMDHINSATKGLTGKNGLKAFDSQLKELSKDVKNSKIADHFKVLSDQIKKSDIVKQLTQLTKTIKESVKYWNSLAKPIKTTSNSVVDLGKSAKTLTDGRNGLPALDANVKTLANDLTKYNFGKEMQEQMNVANKAVGDHGFIGEFRNMVNSLKSSLRSFKSTFSRDWKKIWGGLSDNVRDGIKNAESAAKTGFDGLEGKENSFTSSFLKSWRSWVDDVVSSMESGFKKLPSIASDAMHGIVKQLNKGISGVNSVISQFGGDKKLSTISYAEGTKLPHPGGKAVLNDGNTPFKQELVWQPSRGWSVPRGQYTVHDLEPGSLVMNAKQVQGMLKHRSTVPHYADGNLSDDELEKLGEQFEKHPAQASKDLMLKFTNWNGSRINQSLGKSMAIGLANGIANVLKDLLGEEKEPVNGNWEPVIRSAFAKLGVKATDVKAHKLLRQIQTESGGNEKVPQKVWDINMANGNPAQGLLQFVPSTFRRWAIPGHGNILSGFDQILAAINALEHGGEGGWSNVGQGHGWASGGHITALSRGWIADNPEHDEYVINPYNDNALPLLNEAYSKVAMRRPDLRTHQSDNSQVIALLKVAVDRLSNINMNPVVRVQDVRDAINQSNAKNYAMMKGSM